jgi:hypothetical protein
MDCIPVVSQIKSVVQCGIGDWEGASTTQDNFTKQCIIVSQVRSVVEHIQGDEEAANDTIEVFFQSTDAFLKKVPILGHARGCVAYLTGNKQVGDETMFQATKTTVGMAMIAFFLHGGFLIGSGLCIVAEREREVDSQALSKPSREANTPKRMNRVGTTNVALHKLEMLDKKLDAFCPAFGFPVMALLASKPATTPRHREVDFSDLKTGVKVIQCIDDSDSEDELMVEEGSTRQVSTMSAYECRNRLQQWRQDMVAPRL